MGSFISRVLAPLHIPYSPDPTTSTSTSTSTIIRDSRFVSLPPDILISVLERLNLVDRIRFGSVCSSFLSAFKAQQCLSSYSLSSSSSSSLSSLPWLLLPYKSTDTNIAFFSIIDRKMYKIPQLSQSHHLWLGSSQGWLVAIDRGTSLISLLNPITRTNIPLPPVLSVSVSADSSPKLLCLEFSKATLSWNYTSSSSSSSSSSKGYAVVLLLAWPSSNWPSTMLCARDGDKAWIPFGSRKDVYTDAAFHNGRCYAMQYNGSVEAWDLSSGTGTPPLLTVVIMPSSQKLFLSSTRYLVGSEEDGGILHVSRSSSSSDPSEIDFKIFKLDSSNKEWVEMESLEGRLLFLSSYCSVSLSTRNHPEFEADDNCIYFDRITPGKERQTLLLMMEDRSLKKILHHGSYWNPSPIWIEPSLLRKD